jgi:heme oxygenase
MAIPQSHGSAGLAQSLRDGTAALHARAERSGILADLLRGAPERAGYALLLRNLLPVYRAIEDGLERQRDNPLLRPFARPELYRAAAISADLAALYGPDWPERLGLLPAGARYAFRAARAAAGDGVGLIAHAYVRTLGDLSGGRILAKLLARSLNLPPEARRFHEFSAVPDLNAAKAAWRAALDHAAAPPDRVVPEARVAFRLNIALSEAVRDASR